MTTELNTVETGTVDFIDTTPDTYADEMTSHFSFEDLEDNDEVLGESVFKDKVKESKDGLDEERDEFEKQTVESFQEFAEKFDDIPDDIGFKIGDQVVSKAALKEALESQHTIEQREAELKPYYENIRVRAEMIQDALDMGKTETERMYEHFKSIAENPNTMASERGNAFSKMKDLERKYATLEAKQEEIKQERTKAEVERVSLQINAIEKSFPSQLEGWKPGESLQEVLDFAQSQGVSKSQLGNAFSPGLIKLLWIAKKAEDHKASSRQKLTEIVKAPRSVSSTASKREQAVDPKKSELLRKIDKHAITRKDVDTMFNMLED